MTHSLLQLASVDSAGPVGVRAGVAVSRSGFVARIHSWHNTLQAHTGRQFALYLDDSIEFAAALFGAWHAGKTVWLCADTLPASLTALRSQVDGFIGSFPAACNPVVAPDSASAAGTLTALEGDFVGLVVHTSGSTGAAQAIPKKLAQLAGEVATLEQMFGSRLGNASVIATVSHHHIYGLLFRVLWPLFSGRIMHAETLQYPEQLLPYLESCVLIASPAHLKRLPQHLDWPAAQLVFCSGGVLPAQAALSCAALLGQAPVEVYGSSETGGIAWRQRKELFDDAWQALPGVEWRAASNDLIEVRSAHLYTDHWLTLADRIEPLPDGRFRLNGRSDRIVKIEEKRISLDALEQRLIASQLVEEARVLPLPAAQGQREHLGALLVLSQQGRAVLEQQGKLFLTRQLKAALQEQVESVALPRRWRFVDQMPFNAQGKTTQAMVLALFDENDAQPVTAPQTILKQHDSTHAELEVRWPHRLHYFAGHFPNAPVLPGVAQVQWAIQLARQLFDIPAGFHGMHGLKFQQVIFPDDVTRLILKYDAHKASLNFSFSSGNRQHSSGRILFGPGVTHAH